MSAFPDSEIAVPMARPKGLSPAQFAAIATGFAVLGVLAIWPTMLTLWNWWTTDATKSLGILVPLASLVLILRAWRAIGWQAEGSWWGLAVLLPTIAAAWVQQRAVLILVVSPQWSTALPPPSLVLMAYASGVVLLFGGTRLLRAALFPILLLWFVNPIPHVFSRLVDLPLQTVSAHMARVFAVRLGQHLTPNNLRLMFTPEFGMFIAPGCNGIRGSVTMGFIALIAGYLYRFRWHAYALVVMGAILLGYVFNLVRLCLLVLYYVAALHFTSLQNKAEGADYLIGGVLFLVATRSSIASATHRLRMRRRPRLLQAR
jgi:exosortase J